MNNFIYWFRYSGVFECNLLISFQKAERITCRYQKGNSDMHSHLSYLQNLILSTWFPLLNTEPDFLFLPCSMLEGNPSQKQFRTVTMKGSPSSLWRQTKSSLLIYGPMQSRHLKLIHFHEMTLAFPSTYFISLHKYVSILCHRGLLNVFLHCVSKSCILFV